MDILVKVSGSLLADKRFYEWLSSKINPLDRLFVLPGGGEKITELLNEKNIPFDFGPQGREIGSEEGGRLAGGLLDELKAFVEGKLRERGIKANVFSPVIKIKGEKSGEVKICHINGDKLAEALYPNFEKIYIVTLKRKNQGFSKRPCQNGSCPSIKGGFYTRLFYFVNKCLIFLWYLVEFL